MKLTGIYMTNGKWFVRYDNPDASIEDLNNGRATQFHGPFDTEAEATLSTG